jgi:glucuronoarabinoxylan endo-1,4-beta-xylanase
MSAFNRRRWVSVSKAVVSVPVLAAVFFAASNASAEVVVELDALRQTIDGFGASSAFFSEDISQEDADFLFDAETGIGLSLVRVRLNHQDNDTTDIETAKKAYAHGVKIWAAPWTPPPEFKTNNDLPATGGASLKTASYADFATYLADFVDWMEEQGVPIVAITPQNEPDYESSWDGCMYTPAQMTTFIGEHLGPTFEARGIDVAIVAPDTARLSKLPEFTTALLGNANAKKYLKGVSTHPYSTSGFSLDWSVPRDNGLFFWQTEISWEAQNGGGSTDTPDPGMKTALWMTKMMHEHLTKLWMNAWSYWNLIAVADNYADDAQRKNPALIQDGVKFKRAFAMGNFSKFVRPGFIRVEATPAPATDLYFSAYKSPTGHKVSVVAINDGSSAATQTVKLTGTLAGAVIGVTPYVTSDTLELAAQTAVTYTAADNSFAAALPAKSVTTFVVDVDAPEPGGSGGAGAGGSSGSGGAAGAAGSGGSAGGATAGGASGSGGAGGGGLAGASAGGASAGAGPAASGGTSSTATGGASASSPTGGATEVTDSGCGCRVGSKSSGGTLAMWALGLAFAATALVRRRRSRA